ncbi:MAG: hypothetical protein WC011_00010 [Candidatus Paceibacterota bacterium]
MINDIIALFEKIKEFQSGFIILVLNKKKVLPILIGFQGEKNFSLDVFFKFQKKEVSSLEKLFFDFVKNYNLVTVNLEDLPDDWKFLVTTFAEKEASFKIFKIEDLNKI